jgi:hypothetical protein
MELRKGEEEEGGGQIIRICPYFAPARMSGTRKPGLSYPPYPCRILSGRDSGPFVTMEP